MTGACGCCTVIMNGKAIPSCTVLTIECDGADIRTIEGLQDPNTGELDSTAGICRPLRVSVRILHTGNHHDDRSTAGGKSHPDEEEIKEALTGNYCRCHQPLPGAGGREGRQRRE